MAEDRCELLVELTEDSIEAAHQTAITTARSTKGRQFF
jgi:hypothetical protein